MLKNRKMHKKIICVILIFTFLILFFTISCKTPNTPESNSPTAESGSDNGAANEADAASQNTTEERVIPDIPETADFGGYEFTILTRGYNNADWADWNQRDIVSEGENGELINDAVWVRNTKIEENYNIKVKESYHPDTFINDIQKTIKAGDDTYDIVMPQTVLTPPLAVQGLFYNFFTVPYVELDKPWWNQDALRDLSIGHNLFFMMSDLTVMQNEATSAMVFNKKLLQDYQLESPYDLVKDGKWTFAKMVEMAKAACSDLDGDGIMDIQKDQFGIIDQGDSAVAYYLASGENVVSKNSDDYPYITFENDRSYSVLTDVLNMLCDTDLGLELHRYEGKFPIYEFQTQMFSENRALFSWIRMRVVETLRSMEADFGIIPLPKYDETQTKYYSQINSHTSVVICVPVTASDLNRTGLILEALSAESKYTLQPAYYELNIRTKFTRDEESLEMLDIIFGSRVFDMSEIYNFGGFTQEVSKMARNNKTDFISTYEKLKVKIETDIAKTIEKYEALTQ